MNGLFRIRDFDSQSENRKSKTCAAFDKLCCRARRVEPSRSTQNRKWLGLSAIVLTLGVTGGVAEPQQSTKIPKIGFLGARPATSATGADRLRREFRVLCYTEGKNFTV
jgi:hypothetical protein